MAVHMSQMLVKRGTPINLWILYNVTKLNSKFASFMVMWTPMLKSLRVPSSSAGQTIKMHR